MNRLHHGSLPFLVVVLVLGLVACGRPINPRADAITSLTVSVAAGKVVYDASCVSCHGADGRGSGVNLPTALRYYSAEEMVTVIVEGTEGTDMASWSSLTDQQIADVYAYMRSFPR